MCYEFNQSELVVFFHVPGLTDIPHSLLFKRLTIGRRSSRNGSVWNWRHWRLRISDRSGSRNYGQGRTSATTSFSFVASVLIFPDTWLITSFLLPVFFFLNFQFEDFSSNIDFKELSVNFCNITFSSDVWGIFHDKFFSNCDIFSLPCLHVHSFYFEISFSSDIFIDFIFQTLSFYFRGISFIHTTMRCFLDPNTIVNTFFQSILIQKKSISLDNLFYFHFTIHFRTHFNQSQTTLRHIV